VRLALLAEAEAELEDAATWYDDRSEGLGDEFMGVAREAMTLVAESPETWPLWPKAPARIPPVRRFLLPRFPYAFAYQVLADVIVVLAVVHVRRRPLYWIGRAR
jgi:plasmid stabilization system protein ParE